MLNHKAGYIILENSYFLQQSTVIHGVKLIRSQVMAVPLLRMGEKVREKKLYLFRELIYFSREKKMSIDDDSYSIFGNIILAVKE